MIEQAIWSIEQLLSANLGKAAVWATPSVRELVTSTLPYTVLPPLAPLPEGLDSLIVVGGGTLIDQAKAYRRAYSPGVFLIAVPSIWGSGAEASPVVVLNGKAGKDISANPEFVPDVRVVWPDLAYSVPQQRAVYACGDCWAHALEGLLSPLADHVTQKELASLTNELVEMPLASDHRWFDLSARVCAAQARSSVGLVHGIAHTLERDLSATPSTATWGHARLCSVVLWPTMRLNRLISSRFDRLVAKYDVDPDRVLSRVREFFDEEAYAEIYPLIQSQWARILRDPCTRTNGVLIRPQYYSDLAPEALR